MPCLLGPFSLVTSLGTKLTPRARRAAAAGAWRRKQRPAVSGTLAAVRRGIWREPGFVTSARAARMQKPRPALRNAVTCALRQAA